MRKIISLALAIISLISVISCSRQELIIEEEKKETKTLEETKTEAPIYTKKHKSIDEFEIDFDDPDFDPFDRKQIKEKMSFKQFEGTIESYEKAPIETGKVIFYGSSCFTRWSKQYGNIPLEECITGTLNHGFGGSCVHQLCYYYDRMIKPYEPKAIVITSFINDRAAGYSNVEMMKLVGWLCNKAKSDFPDIKIYITDFRPVNKERSKSEVNEFKELNGMLLKYAEKHDYVKIIELSKEPFYYTDPQYAGTYNNINGSIFIADNMHFTPEGYAMLTEVMKKALAEIL